RRHYDRDHAPPGSGLYGRTASAIDQLSARPACGAAVFPLHGRCGKHRRGVPALPAWQESLPERGRESAEAAARSGPGRCRDALSGVTREIEEPAPRGVQVTPNRSLSMTRPMLSRSLVRRLGVILITVAAAGALVLPHIIYAQQPGAGAELNIMPVRGNVFMIVGGGSNVTVSA